MPVRARATSVATCSGRAAVWIAGDNVGLNFDPSHIFWMGGDPLQTMQALGELIYHVHAKDTRIESNTANTMTDMTPFSEFPKRSWNYVTVGYGHGEEWWIKFVVGLRTVGYDDVLVIETSLDETVRAGMKFDYRISNETDGREIAAGYTKHAFTDGSGKVVRPPGFLRDLIKKNSP